jgi:cytidylate kinase
MIRIAIDGPGGAGKSTIAKIVAEKLGIEYIDTGAMYRAIALKMLRCGLDGEDAGALDEMLEGTVIDFRDGDIFLDGENVSGLIRTPEVSMKASHTSKIPAVRKKLVALQREIASGKSIVMDGRDIGTNVLKNAEVKIFMTASAEVRARRRCDQLKEAGREADFDSILADINERDYQDTHRELNPLAQAEDAVLIDTSDMTIEQVAERILEEAGRVPANGGNSDE